MDYCELAKSIIKLKFTNGSSFDEFAASGTKGEDGVLFELYESDKDLLAGNLARDLKLTSGRIANILRQLEKKGYIVRNVGIDDRRKIYVSLTEEGRTYFAGAYESYIERYEKLLKKLGDKDAGEFVRIIKKATSD